MRMMCRPKWPLLLRYVSRNMRCIDFPQVDGLSTDTPILGRHRVSVRDDSYLKSTLSNDSVRAQGAKSIVARNA